ncbi:MAG: DUF6114 domain-containing protein [Thermoplasmata archaeon]
MANKPTVAFVLSLIGGILILLVALVFAAVLLVVGTAFLFLGRGTGASIAIGYGVGGLLIGILIIAFAGLLLRHPRNHVGYGIAIVVLSLVSIVVGAGFYLGLILAFVGGILAIVYQPGRG